MKPAVIIPVYNHGRQVGEVIRQTLQLSLPVFVIDDGSTDSTAQVLDSISEENAISILRHSVNLGKGAAILTGFAAALKNECDWAITLDADGQHNPEDAKHCSPQ